ncbi:hypothetical protein [Gordonia araii]|nr:hypothetical protein [Gordonia araii]NNG98253.1 hypothetical protein [Gordonia araii NBRC 100433]
MKLTATLASTAVAFGVLATALQAAPAQAAPRPIPPPAYPIPPTKPRVHFWSEDFRLAFKVTDLPRGEKVCFFEAYLGDPLFGSLGVRSWQPAYERYELGTTAKARSVRHAPGIYPVKVTCRMHGHLLAHRAGEIRIPNTRR